MWAPHAKEGWVGGEILSFEEGGKHEQVIVKTEDGEVRVNNPSIIRNL